VSIDCRLDILVGLVQGATDLGRLERALERAVVQARERKIAAETFDAAGQRKKAKSYLHKASRRMVHFNYRVRSLVGRRIIPDPTTEAFLELSDPILEDMRILLRTL
jgi:hypothetical protein